MSEYIKAKTCFKITNVAELLAALVDMKPEWKNRIEVHQTAQNLFGYTGDRRTDKAEIIIRRGDVGIASNDIGFKYQDDGTITAIISAYDQNRYGKSWQSDLAKSYAYRVAEKQAVKVGATITKTVNENGTWTVKLVKEEEKVWVARKW